jgi:hypothetical protein
MLSQLTRPLSGRKRRLLLCGYVRLFRHLLSDPRVLRAVEVGERFVDDRRTTKCFSGPGDRMAITRELPFDRAGGQRVE